MDVYFVERSLSWHDVYSSVMCVKSNISNTVSLMKSSMYVRLYRVVINVYVIQGCRHQEAVSRSIAGACRGCGGRVRSGGKSLVAGGVGVVLGKY